MVIVSPSAKGAPQRQQWAAFSSTIVSSGLFIWLWASRYELMMGAL